MHIIYISSTYPSSHLLLHSLSHHIRYDLRKTDMDEDEKKQGKKPTSWRAPDESSKGMAVNMNEQEEDLIYRMYRLVGKRWDLIAGRLPGRTPEEVERFWKMRQGQHSHKG